MKKAKKQPRTRTRTQNEHGHEIAKGAEKKGERPTVRAQQSRARSRTPTTNTTTKQGSDMEYGATRARIANTAVFLARYIENPLSGAPAT